MRKCQTYEVKLENDANVSPNVQYNNAINHMIKESLNSFKHLSSSMKNAVIKTNVALFPGKRK